MRAKAKKNSSYPKELVAVFSPTAGFMGVYEGVPEATADAVGPAFRNAKYAIYKKASRPKKLPEEDT
jgi:hypothetical protein